MTEERKIYMEKKKIVHIHEEILTAFENSYSICFELSSERTPSSKSNLFGGIWQINPEAIITEADLCVMSTDPTVYRKQFLVIDNKGDDDSIGKILGLMSESGVVASCYVAFKDKKEGIKRCVLEKFDGKAKIIKKINLLNDDGKLLLTVRAMIKKNLEE